MKRLIIITLAVLTICTAINVFIARAQAQYTPVDCDRTYIFAEFDGYVAYFEENETKPFLVTTRRVHDLTPTDRTLLKEGFPVKSARSMSRLLEDLCS